MEGWVDQSECEGPWKDFHERTLSGSTHLGHVLMRLQRHEGPLTFAMLYEAAAARGKGTEMSLGIFFLYFCNRREGKRISGMVEPMGIYYVVSRFLPINMFLFHLASV